MASVKNITITHPTLGNVITEMFSDDVQFKLFLKMVHNSLALKQDLTTFNGVDFLIHIPYNILNECLIVGQLKELSMSEVLVAKSKLEG
jgi:hypothetical protein